MTEKEFRELQLHIEQSGETILSCLRQRGVTKTSYYKWRKVYSEPNEVSREQLCPISFAGTKEHAASVCMSPAQPVAPSDSISITLPGGSCVQFPVSMADDVLMLVSSKLC